MDKHSEKEKSSSRKPRDSDRDKDKDHKHRNSKSIKSDVADGDDHHHRHHRSKTAEDRHKSRDDHRRRDRERSEDEREGRDDDRHRSRRRDRERSEEEREGSRERVHDVNSSNKRKERGESEDRAEKRVRVSERKRFEDKIEETNVRDRRKVEDDRVEEEIDVDGEQFNKKGYLEEETVMKREPKDEPQDYSLASNKSGSNFNGAVMEPLNMSSRILHETSLAPSHPSSTKVSSLSTTHENKGVNSNRSHEVPGKSSTDGTAPDAGKSGGFSLDALAKAKRALQMQKDIQEKLKKISVLNKGSRASTDGGPQVLLKEGHKAPSYTTGIFPAPIQPVSTASTFPAVVSSSVKLAGSGLPHIPGLTASNVEAVKIAQEKAAKLGFRQDPQFAPLINMFPGQMPPEVIVQPKPAKAPVLRLDAFGREIDEHGNVVNMPKLKDLSTLKVNKKQQKIDAFQILKPELVFDPETNPHFDPRMGIDKTKLLRPKKMTFQFVEEGKWSKDAEIIKLKSQFGEAQAKELKAKQAQLAKAKAEPDINPNLIEVSERVFTAKEKPKEPIPEVEWWDLPFLRSGTYGDTIDGKIAEDSLKMDKITIYVEHPRPIEPPAEPAPPPPQPLKLTQKERKKLRTQRRLATEKNRQEMIRQGLIEPPKPKVKMSNLMKVLGSEAVQDPTKLEKEIRSAAAEREQAHADRNVARKLTPAERREKKERKLFDDPNTLETIVSVYKINDLSHPQTRFKVDVNAQENHLTGCAVISDGITVVVVEGGSKAIKRYQKLMLKRINWATAVKEDQEEDDEEKTVNKCVLVWQGSLAKASFNRFFVHECRTEAAARKVFSDAGVAHYWDLSVNFTEDLM